MKHVIRKLYYNYEKEEKWLNEMALKGMALSNYSWCKYAFEDCEPGEYIYRIELLGNLPTHPNSIAYIKFMQEIGVEHVASYMRWVYFRKKASEGQFDLYSDIESRITHYKRINLLWSILALAESLIGGLSIIIMVTVSIMNGYPIGISSIIIGALPIIIGFLFLYIDIPIRKKIKDLVKEKNIRE